MKSIACLKTLRAIPQYMASPNDRACAATRERKEVSMTDPRSSPSVPPQQAGSPNLSHVSANKRNRYRAFWLSCVIITSASAIVGIAVYSVFFLNIRGHTSADRDSQAFCCPQEAETMARYVNVSLNPCKDFFLYVCSRVIRDKLWARVALQVRLEQVVVTGVWPQGVRKGKAGIFLAAFHKSCVETIGRRDLFLSDLASGLTTAMREFLVKPDSRNALGYIITASMKYQLPPELEVRYDPLNSSLMFLSSLHCEPHAHRLTLHALAAAVGALKDVLNVTAVSRKAVELRTVLCNLVPNETSISTYPPAELHVSFNRDAWNGDDLATGLRLLDLRDTATTVYVESVRIMKAVHDAFSAESVDREDGYKSAYLLWGSIDSGAVWFFPGSGGSGAQFFDTCNTTIFSFKALWELFTAEVFTTREKDVMASAVFATVKNAVHRESLSSSLFEPADAEEVNNFFTSISITSPLASSERLLEVPKPQHNFVDNLLRGREYDFEVARFRTWGLTSADILYYSPAQLTSRHRYELPAMHYAFLNSSKSGNSKIPEMADLGRLVSESLWSFVLYGRSWSPKTAVNIERLQACLAGSAFSAETNRTAAERLTVHILGLSSVLSVLNRTDWYTEKPAWSIWSLSHAQLFYILSTFERCPKNVTLENARYINAPLASLEDFAKAFHCSSEPVMAGLSRCMGHGSS